MANAISIEIWKLPGGSMSADAREVASALLTETPRGYVVQVISHRANGIEYLGFIAKEEGEGIWGLVGRVADLAVGRPRE